MRPQLLLLASFLATSSSASDCNEGYSLCAPNGATSSTVPPLGSSDFQNLFNDIVSSSLPASKRSLPLEARGSASLCCVSSLSCLAMANLAIPFCYDKFTTNFFLPDGSYGTVVGGSYTSSSGDHANLETGDYTLANGTTGNIYSTNAAAKPNLSVLVLPSQFTGTGAGSAIPVTNLGSPVTLTYTLTYPGTTVNPTTIPGTQSLETILVPLTTTVSASGTIVTSVASLTETLFTSLSGSTVPGTTKAASTVTFTTTSAAGAVTAGGATASASTTTKKNGASRNVEFSLVGGVFALLGMGIVAVL